MARAKITHNKSRSEPPTLAQPKHNALSLLTNSSESVLQVFFGLVPLFLVTVRSWTSAILIIGFFLSIIFLTRQKSVSMDGPLVYIKFKSLIIGTLLAPVIAVAFSSILRGKNTWADYDSASRFLVAIAIFLFVVRKRISMANFFQYTAPSSLALTLMQQLCFPQTRIWGADRMSTYFADPLVFGYTSLTLSLISLVSINLLTKDSNPVVAFKLVGAVIGLYLSIMSGSRTGWFAIPIIIVIWLTQQKQLKGKSKYLHLGIYGLAAAVTLVFFEFSFPLNQRFSLGFHEIFDYSWGGIASESSVGFRITFLRVAFDMFTTHPLTGFGETRNELSSLPKHIYTYASPESIRLALTAGFHNEIVTNAVRYGVAGLVASVMLFVVPLYIFACQMRSVVRVQRANALVGLVFATCVLISSLSTEVFDLKYMASFYALMITLLLASSVAACEQEQPHSHYHANSDKGNL